MSARGKFWGCMSYPSCRGTRDVMGAAQTRFESDTVRRGGDEDDSMPTDRWKQRDRRRWE
jgi:ssDNA-binding Zn-finger/Zn-ribbon topoisomerase 1